MSACLSDVKRHGCWSPIWGVGLNPISDKQFHTQHRVSPWWKPISENLNVIPGNSKGKCGTSSAHSLCTLLQELHVWKPPRQAMINMGFLPFWFTSMHYVRLSIFFSFFFFKEHKKWGFKKFWHCLPSRQRELSWPLMCKLGRQMKQLCGLSSFALKSDQDGCLPCIIPQRQLVIISINNML